MIGNNNKRNITIVTPSFFYKNISSDSIEILKRVGALIGKQKDRLIISLSDEGSKWAAESAHVYGGISVGFSPAVSQLESKNSYREHNPWVDVSIYTGAGGIGHLSVMLESADFLFVPVFDQILVPVIEDSLQHLKPVLICSQESQDIILGLISQAVRSVSPDKNMITVSPNIESCLDN